MSQQTLPQTRAERTRYAETSHYDDVIAFLEALKLPIVWMATSDQGRKVPLVTLGKGKLKVYIQANIHGGEVEGKEAALMLLRDLPKSHSKLLEKLTLIICPIYNCDGNEKWGDGKRNRGSQDGPEKIGERPNGAGLDMNRDCMKAESPEMRGVLEHVYLKHDPAVVMDLHTTNGTRHGYHLTYSPPLNPNSDPSVLGYVRDSLLPIVRKRLETEKAWKLFDYGNVERRGAERVWATFGEEPRYVTNYAGLRGRLSILSEAVSFLPFETRVKVTYDFVLAILEEAAKDSAKILKLVKDADKRRRSELGVRFEMAVRGTETIPLEKLGSDAEVDHRKAPKELEQVMMPVLDRFKASKSRAVPKGYLVTDSGVLALLERQGLKSRPATLSSGYERFSVLQKTEGRAAFQGHKLVQLEGEWKPAKGSVSGRLFATDQPLQALLFHLLEPESLDGLVAWGLTSSESLVRVPPK
ncbi:M14 family metallopeptidase [Armatimonas sp.]|uniref:M14 family metallopeptidase n=1 Tax=Armatimonas sp. TaxID=1872638 RepID=UPI00286CFCF3|nr:M14 family metallopeptidase [Armatimonas sp.]